MKLYIFMFGIGNIVAGGPIYNRNKIKYLEEHEWDILVYPTQDGEVFIKGLEKFSGKEYDFLRESPFSYTKKQQDKLINHLVSMIPNNYTEIIIETGTDYTAYWGELLAKRINAKHFIFFLDESNPRITKMILPFYKFKYDRHELACISEDSMILQFGKHWGINKNEAYSLKAECTNSVEDYPTEILSKISQCDYIIGSIGRLDKSFVDSIINGFISFAYKVYPKKVMVCFFGGAEENRIKSIKQKFDSIENIDVLISGYLWPLPLKALKKCELFVSGSGSAMVSAKCEIPTIEMDIYNNTPIDYITNPLEISFTSEIENKLSLSDMLYDFFVRGYRPNIKPYNLEEEWKLICEEFDKHMDFLYKYPVEMQYYEFENVVLNKKDSIKKILRFLLGVNLFKHIKEINPYRKK